MSTVKAIIMATPPTHTDYTVGFDKLDLAGGLINLVYDDGTFSQVPLDESMGYFVDNSKVGKTSVTVKYQGLETSFAIEIHKPRLVRVSIISPPNKTSYIDGDTIDLAGLRLLGHYDNGVELELHNIPDVPSSKRTAKTGETVIPISIEGVTIPVLIQVTQAKIESLRIRDLPKKKEYISGIDSLDVSGGMLEKQLSNGHIELVPLTEDMVSGFNPQVVGTQTLTAHYAGFNCNFQVEVLPRHCERLELKALPMKRVYTEGTPFELCGVSVVAHGYGTTWDVPTKDLRLETETATLGATDMVLCYDDSQLRIPVTIVAKTLTDMVIKALPTKLTYKEGSEDLDTSGGMLELHYNNGAVDTLPLTEDMTSGFSNLLAGSCHVDVAYGGFFTHFTVTITPKQLVGIYVATPPHKKSYAVGEAFESEGMEIVGLYDNGEAAPIQEYKVSPSGSLNTENKVVVISVGDKTAVTPIVVSAESTNGVSELPIEDTKPEPSPVPEPAPAPKPTHNPLPLRRRAEVHRQEPAPKPTPEMPKSATEQSTKTPKPTLEPASETPKPDIPKAERFYPGTLALRFDE